MNKTLIAARALISDPAHWTNWGTAEDANGAYVWASSPKATRWSAAGALGHASREHGGYAEAVALLGPNVCYDVARTTHGALLALFDKAITS